jgi:hypothetical protein
MDLAEGETENQPENQPENKLEIQMRESRIDDVE